MKNSSFNSPLMFWAQAVGAASAEGALAGAIKTYQRGDYPDALAEFTVLANDGHRRAQHFLGEMYANGEGTPPAPETAVSWYLKAAHRGFERSQLKLAQIYADGLLGISRDVARAYAWFDIAAAKGNADAATRRDTISESMSKAQLKQGRSLSIELEAINPDQLERGDPEG